MCDERLSVACPRDCVPLKDSKRSFILASASSLSKLSTEHDDLDESQQPPKGHQEIVFEKARQNPGANFHANGNHCLSRIPIDRTHFVNSSLASP